MPLLSRPTTEMFTCFFFTPKILARAEKKTDMVGVGGWVDVVVNRGLKGSVSLMIGVRVWYGSVPMCQQLRFCQGRNEGPRRVESSHIKKDLFFLQPCP